MLRWFLLVMLILLLPRDVLAQSSPRWPFEYNPLTFGIDTTHSNYPSWESKQDAGGGNASYLETVTVQTDRTGVLDAAPAFKSAMGSNRKIIVPPGTYRFASVQNSPCCAFDNPSVLVQGFSNFVIEGYGATIITDPSIALSAAFHFDQDTNFTVMGLAFQGSRAGLTAGQENGSLALSSDVGFDIRDLTFIFGFGGNGAPFGGDWLVNGSFSNIRMSGVGHCFDLAYLLNVRFSGITATGADTNGASGTGQLGQTCFSVITDPPNVAQNHTGIAFTATEGVNVSGFDESNFNTGAYINTGTGYVFSGNRWHDNPGISGSPGLGMWIRNDGSVSRGAPPQSITIADTFQNNGAAVAGYGLLLSASAAQSGDVLAHVSITGSSFINNAITGLGTDGIANFSDINVLSNQFSGAAQTTAYNPSLATVVSMLQQGGVMALTKLGTSGSITVSNNQGVYMLDGTGNPQPILSLSSSNIAYFRPSSAAAYMQFQNYAGTGELRILGGTNGGITLNNHVISTATTLPAVSTCGTTPSLTAQSTDHSGTVTTGSSAVSTCTVSFAISYASALKCVVSASSGGMPVAAFVGARKGNTIIVNFAAAITSGIIDYNCEQ